MAMTAKKNMRSTARQIEMLVDYMSTHTLFANGEYRGPLGREGQDEQWVQLQQLLQEYGPNKTVEQWRTTWRDLKKKARADGARVNSARAETGNERSIPSLSDNSLKILGIIGTESAYGMAGQQETGLGEMVPQPPPPPTKSPPPDTTPSTLISPGPSTPIIVPPSTPSTATATQPALARGQRARTRSLGNDFLASDAETRRVLQDISNNLIEKRKLVEIKMRRSHLDRLHSSRMATHRNMGPKN